MFQKSNLLCEEFNKKYENGKISFQGSPLEFILRLPSNSEIKSKIETIFEENFYRQRIVDDYGRRVSISELRIPKVNERKVMAWGLYKSQ